MQLSTNDNTIFFQVKKLPVNWPAKVYIKSNAYNSLYNELYSARVA